MIKNSAELAAPPNVESEAFKKQPLREDNPVLVVVKLKY